MSASLRADSALMSARINLKTFAWSTESSVAVKETSGISYRKSAPKPAKAVTWDQARKRTIWLSFTDRANGWSGDEEKSFQKNIKNNLWTTTTTWLYLYWYTKKSWSSITITYAEVTDGLGTQTVARAPPPVKLLRGTMPEKKKKNSRRRRRFTSCSIG